MKRHLSSVLLPLLLAACSTVRPEPEIRIQKVYCVTPDQFKRLVQTMPEKVGGQLTGDAQKDFKIVAGSDVALRVYANGLLDVIGGCTSPK